MKELTDEEVIQTLEHCIRIDCYDKEGCLLVDAKSCVSTLLKNALKLINRQKAKIERLEAECVNQCALWSKHYESIFETTKEIIESEARKKFAHQLKILLETKAKLYSLSDKDCEFAIVQSTALKTVDNLLKEMESETDGNT